ncbi:protein NDH-DEPENDENT CYCLIC ELECTRON FLOW 5 [Magnolia sinica]|uniref:protein NDH-DEPENDENT CYCLIC ELECTRON FLOW 5 n=1 Tax=Magnolia sinica TaxID=86752 RepID=UPI002659BBCE|nr:protein NDH-DEPENDENT CYCLIC ELECTRON FLOW 5 [Magnolia sinica]
MVVNYDGSLRTPPKIRLHGFIQPLFHATIETEVLQHKAMAIAMSVAYTSLFSTFYSTNQCMYLKHRRHFSLQAINVDYLKREFSGHGAHFSAIGDSCVVKMGIENGSGATLMLPSGLITSYKPHMWHGGTLEVLHTSVSEGEDGGGPIVRGGVSMDMKCGDDDGGPTWAPRSWALHDVRGSPQKSVQVELKCNDSEHMVEFKYIVTLHQDLLSSEIIVTNLKSSAVHLTGSVISHLTVSTPDATYAVGLQGSNYSTKPPLVSDFSIIPPGYFGQKKLSGSGQSWGQKALQGLFPSWGGSDKEFDGLNTTEGGDSEEEMEGEEDDNYAHLTEKMSRIYTSAPRKFTVLDRGRRNSVIVRRIGFDELYVFSPGSSYEWYGKYAYICTGPSAWLKPIVLGPNSVWSGAQYLHNPNL